jgi:hypothetical protein
LVAVPDLLQRSVLRARAVARHLFGQSSNFRLAHGYIGARATGALAISSASANALRAALKSRHFICSHSLELLRGFAEIGWGNSLFYFATRATNDECTQTHLLTAKFVSDSKRASGRRGETWLKSANALRTSSAVCGNPIATRHRLPRSAHFPPSARCCRPGQPAHLAARRRYGCLLRCEPATPPLNSRRISMTSKRNVPSSCRLVESDRHQRGAHRLTSAHTSIVAKAQNRGVARLPPLAERCKSSSLELQYLRLWL